MSTFFNPGARFLRMNRKCRGPTHKHWLVNGPWNLCGTVAGFGADDPPSGELAEE
jgi:hypothetical protein